MKKSILLMNNTLSTGGISASMVNVANELSKDYNVSVFCYIPEGAQRQRLSNDVHILDTSWRLVAMCSTLSVAKKMGIKYVLFKIFARVWSTIFDNRFPIYLALKHQKPLGRFDLACSYTHEGTKHIEYTGLIRVLLNKVDSPKKLSWIHCDYNNVKNSKFNNRYFNKVYSMVGVSQAVADAFMEKQQVSTNVEVCYNMLDYKSIYEKADEPLDFEYPKDGIVCFSACRLSPIKGIARMIKSCSDVFKQNNVYWFIAGDGPEKATIKKEISANGLDGRVVLIGERVNPFNYMKHSDLYINVSYEEAAPLVFLESKALHVPVFATNTLSAKELLDETVDFVVENEEESIRKGFVLATQSKQILEDRKEKLSSYIGSNKKSIDMFRKWLGDLDE